MAPKHFSFYLPLHLKKVVFAEFLFLETLLVEDPSGRNRLSTSLEIVVPWKAFSLFGI